MGGYTVQEVIIYPIKSCKGLSVPEACLSVTGFRFDREWMVVGADKGRPIGQLDTPKLAVVLPTLPLGAFKGDPPSYCDALEINAPGMNTLKVPLKPCSHVGNVARGERGSLASIAIESWSGEGVDEGPQAAAWWTNYLGHPARFVRLNAERAHRKVEDATDNYLTGFTKSGQFHIISEGSLQELNRRLRRALPMNRFRPNIIVRGPPPFEEDKWGTIHVLHKGKRVSFTFVKECARRKVPTVNQENPQEVDEEPLKTLAKFRSGEALGLHQGTCRKQAYFGAYFVCEETLHMKDDISQSSTAIGVGDIVCY